MLFSKLLCALQLSDFQTGRLTQLNSVFYNENRLTSGVPHMNVNWCVLVGIEIEAKSFLFEDLGHWPILTPSRHLRKSQICLTFKMSHDRSRRGSCCSEHET